MGSVICNTPDQIQAYRLLSLKAMLSIEVKTGMVHSRGSVAEAIRKTTGLTSKRKAKLLEEYIQWLTIYGYLS